MRIGIKILVAAGLAVVIGVTNVAPVKAHGGFPDTPPTPITIDGTVVTDNNKPAVNKTIMAWCSDTSHFAGPAATDAAGYFSINTNSEACPLGWDLAVVVYNENDSAIVEGVGHAIVHTQTTVNITLGKNNPTVPEYGWAGATISLAVGGSVIAVVRRRFTA